MADKPKEQPSSPPKPSRPGAPSPDEGFDLEMLLLLAIVASLPKRR